MAAEVDFGDRELFEQLEERDGPPPPHRSVGEEQEGREEAFSELQERLRGCEETVRRLRAENILTGLAGPAAELKRKLNILTRPSGISVDNSKVDGPLLQILFMNNVISKQYHQEIEDFVFNLIHKYEEQQRDEQEKTHFSLKPQPSSVLLEEDCKTASLNSVKKMKEAFSVVGSVLYFTNFCLDKLGQPILNENPQLTEGWEIPKYQQVFSQILSLDGQEIQVKPKRPKSLCFNCGSEEHQIKDCPKPRNAARISEKRKEFMEACGEASNQNFQQRYHAEEVEERFGKFKPGVISGELQDALGVTAKSLPPFIYRMRQLGYPPGWLKEAEMEHSGLALYDGKDDNETEDEGYLQRKHVTYDVSKLINYPGFNISTPSGIPDEWQMFGSIPMQPSQQKDVFAHYLSNFHAPSSKSSNKRTAPQPSSHHSKRPKDTVEVAVADMDIDSDVEVSQGSQTTNMISTPPPLPQGTPPLDSTMDEDTLTLEELEEQQRLIWAALEQAESTNSDSDIPVDTPLTGNSVTSSPSRNEVDLVAEVRSSDKMVTLETRFSSISEQVPENEHSLTSPNPDSSSPNLKENPENSDSEGLLDNTVPAPNHEVNDGESIVDNKVVTSSESSAKNSNPVPDMSKFAVGIAPFEFENMTESTGTYLRIRSVLKNSPRNQQKKKT
uniref:Zinc finger CCHC domain-containing protein 8 n=1 Tax=Coturnix japonica TaxID=93934 RepID=A0A8C2YHD8_COTJA